MKTKFTRQVVHRLRRFTFKTPSVAMLGLSLALPLVSSVRAEENSPSAMTQLVQMLVEQKTLTPEQGRLLLEAHSQEQAQSEVEKAEIVQQTQKLANAQAVAEGHGAEEGAPPGRVSVRYVPDKVKKQMKDEIKQDVLAQAREENWANPYSMPDWVQRFHPYGDIRIRFETDTFPSGNDPTGQVNFNAINNGLPFDTTLAEGYPPLYNTNADRERMRLRLRLGAEIDVGDNFTAGVRLATGYDNSPITTNQTLGQSGMGEKYAIWLDRAYIAYEVPDLGTQDLTIMAGRFDNPFFHTNLLWDEDLGFDGAVVNYQYNNLENFTPFAVVGIFPYFNTSMNFASTNPVKFESKDRWMVGAQIGTEVVVDEDVDFTIGVAYYDFMDIAGQFSSPITSSYEAGDTDDLRPPFAQKGNTYMALRNNQYAATDPAYGQDYQYYGLATPFRELVLTTQLNLNYFDPFKIWVDGEFVKNLGYDEARINEYGAQNNLQPLPSSDVDSGDMGWLLAVNVGDPALDKAWDWQAQIGYRYLEADAVVDAFTDSNFGLGGTNLEGYFLGARVALTENVWTGVRWMSANNVSGSRYAVDVFQFDFYAKF